MKDMYLRMVEIGNQGANDLGYDGLTDLWFSQYDMPADEFLDETDRVWDELKPLYDALHCHVRDELVTDMTMQGIIKWFEFIPYSVGFI